MKQVICAGLGAWVLLTCQLSQATPLDPVGSFNGDPTTTWDSVAQAGVEVRNFYQPHLIEQDQTVLRRYLQYVPHSVKNSGRKHPLVIALPGGNLSAELFRAWDMGERLERLADKERFIVAYANAVAPSDLTQGNPDNPMFANGGYWRTCFGKPGTDASFFTVDDVAYVQTVIDKMKAEQLPIDTNRIYLMGMSNGGEMAQRLGREMGDEIAGFGAVMTVPSVPATVESFTCPQREQPPIAAMFIYSPGDSLLAPIFESLGMSYADQMTQSTQAWLAALGINPETKRERWLPDAHIEGEGYTGAAPAAVSTMNSQVYRTDYKRGSNGSRMAVLKILDGAGHGWPNATPTPVEHAEQGFNGFINQDINAEAVLWKFFKKHKRRCNKNK